MKKIDQFTNQYALTKTLRFSLIPQGQTYKNFKNNQILEEDEERAQNYQKVKKLIDTYHKSFIEKSLNNIFLQDLQAYARYIL